MATGRIGTTPVLTTRWSKAPSAGTTSLSGLDDNSVSLVYSVGYEAVYQNGVLLSRGNDYTATNGTTITLTTATVAGDIIEVFANQTIPLTDTYTQTVANGKFINNTLTTTTGDIIYASAANTPARLGIGSTGQVLTVSGGIPAWSAAPSPTTNRVYVYFSGFAAQELGNGTFSTFTYANEHYDTDGFHDNSTNNSRLTVPTGLGGTYLIWWRINMQDMSAIENCHFRILKNGTDALQTSLFTTPGSSNLTNSYDMAFVWPLVAGDYIESQGKSDSGTTGGIFEGVQYGFGMARLGA